MMDQQDRNLSEPLTVVHPRREIDQQDRDLGEP